MQTANDLLYDVETSIMENIVTFLSRGSVASANWQIDRLQAYGALNTENRKAIAKITNQIGTLTNKEVAEAMKSALAEIEPQFLKAQKAGVTLLDALPPNASPALRDLLSVYQGRAVRDMNYTMQTLLNNAGSVYVQSVNKASLLLLSGSIAPDEAIAQTVRAWSKSGIPSIVDKAGRQWSTEAYAQMVMRSTVRNVITETQFTRCDEYGTDLIEISSHVDAREGCAPYQGRVFSRNGKTKGYPLLASTSYGDPAGIFGVNCRHQAYGYFPGISTQTYEEKPFDKEAYDNSQTQRRYERDIRQSKRELAVMEKSGNEQAIAKAKDTLKNRQANMRGFLDESGRTRRYSREQIYDIL
jgi:hypothetical protein